MTTGSNRLLLVEDNQALRETLDLALTDVGYDVVVACDGTQALALLHADAAQFEEIVTDIDLGVGPGGWEVGRCARELVADMPVVYISGSGGGEWPAKGVPNSIFVAKPFALRQIFAALAEAPGKCASDAS